MRSRRSLGRWTATLAATLAAAPVHGQDGGVRYAGAPAELSLHAVGDRTLEVLLAPVGPDGRAVEPAPSGILVDYPRQRLWSGRSLDAPVRLPLGGLTVELSPSPLSVTLRRADGSVAQSLSWPGEDGGTHFRTDAPVFGMGEGGHQYDRRGHLHSMRDGNAAFELRTHGAYVAVPMLIGVDGWSLFVHQPVGRANAIDLRGGRGVFLPGDSLRAQPLRLFVTAWDEPAQALSEYTRIAGRAPLPPLWALGYMQSHRTLEGPEQLRRIARAFREKRLPADALIYLGTGFAPTGWNTGHGSFDFNPVVFDDPEAIVEDLHDLDFRVVLHVYSPPRGLHGESVEEAEGDSAHIARYWDRHEPVFARGFDGWWPDGGENLSPESRVARHRMYRLGPLSERPDERPWSLHRTGYSGAHRYGGWIWSGDPSSTWETLATHVPVALNHSVSLSPFWGSDIAGFVPTGELTGELYVRWFQFAAFTPSFRAHGRTWHLRLPWGWNTGGIGPAESSVFEEAGYPDSTELRNALVEPIAREYLHLRYRLLAYNYTLAREAHDAGLPMMRPLWLHHPGDPEAVRRSGEYLWGRDLLVAPVVEKGAVERTLYLPEGEWYDFWTNERLAGGREVTRRVDLATLPLYVRAGAILPLDPVRQHTGEAVEEPVTFRVYPGRDGEYRWYRDDGATLGYERGEYSWTRLRWDDAAGRLTVEPDPRGGGRPPEPAPLRVELVVQGTVLPARTLEWDGGRAEVVFPPEER